VINKVKKLRSNKTLVANAVRLNVLGLFRAAVRGVTTLAERFASLSPLTGVVSEFVRGDKRTRRALLATR